MSYKVPTTHLHQVEVNLLLVPMPLLLFCYKTLQSTDRPVSVIAVPLTVSPPSCAVH